MVTRRATLALAVSAALAATFRPAWAQADATAFVVKLGNELVGIVNGPGSLDDKRRRLTPLVEQAVDIDAIARFCLGRYWRDATPDQQARFTRLFHQVLFNNIYGKLGELQGVGFSPTTTVQKEGDTWVGTVIRRPNQQPNAVQWVVSTANGTPKIVDLVAEGISLRLTQRSDYAAYLQRNGGKVDALLAAVQQQVAR